MLCDAQQRAWRSVRALMNTQRMLIKATVRVSLRILARLRIDPVQAEQRTSQERSLCKTIGGGAPARGPFFSKRWPAAVALLFAAGCCVNQQAAAQTLPNAGSELQQLQRERPKPLPPQGAADFEPPPPLQSVGGATVTATGMGKVYDGTTAATVTLNDSPLSGDSVGVSYGAANFGDKNAGSNKYIDVSGITISGADAVNYTVNSTATAFANITPAPLVVNVTGTNKVYDGTTADTVTLTDTPISGDVVDVIYGSASFSNKNVGNAKTVTVSGMAATGPDAANYTVTPVGTTTANITPASLAVTATGQSKPCDGTILATVQLADNAISGDQVNVADASAIFASASIGNGKQITVSGISIAGGADAGNYALPDTITTTTADITSSPPSQTLTGTWSLQPIQYQSLANAPAVQPPSAGTVASTPPPAVLDMGGVSGTALVNTGATSTGATAPSASLVDGTAGSALPTQTSPAKRAALSSMTPGDSASSLMPPITQAATASYGAGSVGSNAAVISNAAVTSNAAVGSNGAVGSNPGDSSNHTVASGSNVVDNIMSGPLPGASSTSSLVSTDERITVSFVQAAANEPLSGLITVSVPRSVIDTAIEFRFPLPQELLAKLRSTNREARVTLMNGKPLPRWLTFRPSTGVFVVNDMPMRGLPLEVLVRSGAGNWAVMIEDKND